MYIFPLEIVETILDIVVLEDPSLSSVKACALVCSDFHQICKRRIFASIAVHNFQSYQNKTVRWCTSAALQKLLSGSPEIGHYIRHLEYNIRTDDLENISFVETLKKITRLKSLRLSHQYVILDSRNRPPLLLLWTHTSLRSALLHLFHLPTLTHLVLSSIINFFVPDLLLCTNLKSLDIVATFEIDANDVQVPDLPVSSIQLSKLVVKNSSLAASKIYALQRAGGTSFIDFSCLNDLTIGIYQAKDLQVAFDLLRRTKQLTSVRVDLHDWNDGVKFPQIGLFNMLQPSMETLTHIEFWMGYLEDDDEDPLYGLPFELKAMRNINIVESIAIHVAMSSEFNLNGAFQSEWGQLDTALSHSGWPKLREVLLFIVMWCSPTYTDNGLATGLRELPRTQFPNLSESKSVLFKLDVEERPHVETALDDIIPPELQ